MATQSNPYADFHRQCVEASQSWSEQLGDNLRWLDDARSEGRSLFAGLELPTRKTEAWRYTPIAPIVQGDILRLRTTESADAPQGITGDFYTLTFHNGQLAASNIDDSALEVIPFSSADAAGQALIKEYLGKTFDAAKHPFAALNASTLQDGALIRVRKDSKAIKPVQIVHTADVSGEAASSYNRVIVVVESGAKLELLETYVDTHERKVFQNTVTEVFLAANSTMTHYALNCEGANQIHTGCVFVEQQGGSHYEQHAFATGGALKRRDINVKLLGQLASCKLNGVYLAGGREHVDFHTTIEHVAPHCVSEETYKGIINGKGKAVFNGRVHIHRDAQQSSAAMNNNNLLLTNTAEVNTKPELEIYADDVKCAHGATVGQLDDMALFYFQSRGITRSDAHRMLSRAFVESVMAEMEIETAHAYVLELAERFYNEGAQEATA
ncbi:Fe-S cluster assembly protein SufD [Hahella sp. NBU794]|uniref:Fe-S cluster assembly protein SufD n=1 Tax=Hahella sp. NBU794 TaxID=3422590 RepID=UPI003D6DFC90